MYIIMLKKKKKIWISGFSYQPETMGYRIIKKPFFLTAMIDKTFSS